MFLVTDATGHVGKAVIAELAQHAVPVRVLVQPGSEAPPLPANVEATSCNLNDQASVQRAVQGVNAIFLAYERLPQRLTYYVVEDTSVFRENLPQIKALDATIALGGCVA